MYRTICCELWTDDKVQALSPHEKLLFLYLITNPHSHLSGIYYIPLVLIEHEVGLGRAFNGAWNGLLKGHLVQYDEVRSQVWVVNMLPYQANGQKSEKGVANHLNTLHPSSLIERFLERYPQIVSHLSTDFIRCPIGAPSLPHDTFPSPVPSSDSSSSEVKRSEFDQFWTAYPKRKQKEAARRAFEKARKHADWPGIEAVISVIEVLKTTDDWKKENGQFIPYPASWLNAGGWMDEVVSTTPREKCAWTNDEPCQDYAIPGSRYCAPHKEKLLQIQARLKS